MSNAIRSVLAVVFMLAIVMVQTGVNAAPIDQPVTARMPSGVAPVAADAKSTVKVRVLIYSGRPDPEFVIPASQIIPFMKKAKRIAFKSAAGGIIPAALGYKGVLVENPAKAGGLPELFAIYDGKIEAGVKEKIYYVDQSRSLEKFLVKEAVNRKAMEEEVYKRIKIDGTEGGKEGKGKGGE
jgi:hypothetical protein